MTELVRMALNTRPRPRYRILLPFFSLLLSFSSAWVDAETSSTNPNEAALALFETLYQEEIHRSPETMTYLGMRDDYDQWDDLSPEAVQEQHRFYRDQLSRLQALSTESLDAGTRLSYQLYEKKLQDEVDDYQWRLYSYPVNQMFGAHSHVPSFLINIHQVESQEDAEAYIARLRGVDTYMDQVIAQLELRREAHIIAPKFVFPKVIRDAQNLLSGKPFDREASSVDSTLLADFRAKVAALDLPKETSDSLIEGANDALTEVLAPAYRKLIAYLQELSEDADTKDGVWQFADGDAFYAYALQQTTTTDYSPEQIHTIGLKEVERIHGEMREIIKRVGFKGDLQAFFKSMQEDSRFFYPQTEEGRDAYLSKARDIIETMKESLPQLFNTLPRADLTVKAVEPFREKSAGKAFYNAPSLDGKRPGIYYANLSDMSSMPTYQMEALAYHEGVPGHHMQLSIARELDDVPAFRKLISYTAYIEGWGLYSELTPKEIGFYEDPYSDFGRLALELWRACRLVVDTGIHYKQWTREEAIEYQVANTPNSRSDTEKAIERYIVMPSQATAYKIGMLKILELRETARSVLKEDFDIREFHDVVLRNGAVPLDILETLVNRWILEKQQS